MDIKLYSNKVFMLFFTTDQNKVKSSVCWVLHVLYMGFSPLFRTDW